MSTLHMHNITTVATVCTCAPSLCCLAQGRHMSKFRRLTAKLELYGICLLWPIVSIGTVVGSYKLFLWSYGGKECFRFIVIQEPFKEQWYQANPKAVLGYDTPLANVPKFLETPGHDDGAVQHNHHNNY